MLRLTFVLAGAVSAGKRADDIKSMGKVVLLRVIKTTTGNTEIVTTWLREGTKVQGLTVAKKSPEFFDNE